MWFSFFAIEFTIVVWYVYMSGILRTAENQNQKSILGVRDDHTRCLGWKQRKEKKNKS